MIEIKNLTKIYRVNPIVNNLSVTINDGDIISVIGPSGCGKSTFIKCINMLEKPTSGQIFLDGEEITAPGYDLTKVSRKIGMVFQSFNLFDHMTAIENVMVPQIEILKVSKQEAYDKAVELLKGVKGSELELAMIYLNMIDVILSKDENNKDDNKIDEYLNIAKDYLESEDLERNTYYSFMADKCVGIYEYFGWFRYAKILRNRIEEIDERARTS